MAISLVLAMLRAHNSLELHHREKTLHAAALFAVPLRTVHDPLTAYYCR